MDAKQSPKPSVTMNDVNDYCLMHIFQYLPFPDRTRIERVNKRWQEVSRASWYMYSHRLYVGRETAGFPADKRYSDVPEEELTDILKRMLRYRGRYLKQIFFSPACWDMLLPGTLKEILPLCPDIVHLEAENLQVGPDDVLAIFQYCCNIESLGLGWGSNFTDGQLRLVFLSNQKLRNLCVANCQNFTGNCLEELPDNVLEKLEVQYCANFRLTEAAASQFSQSLIKFKMISNFPTDHGIHCIMMLNSLKRITLSLHAEELKNIDVRIIRHAWDIQSNMELTSTDRACPVRFYR